MSTKISKQDNYDLAYANKETFGWPIVVNNYSTTCNYDYPVWLDGTSTTNAAGDIIGYAGLKDIDMTASKVTTGAVTIVIKATNAQSGVVNSEVNYYQYCKGASTLAVISATAIASFAAV